MLLTTSARLRSFDHSANELTQITDDYGVNIWDAIEIANKHPRVDILNPGPGVGGYCIAIDLWFLTEDTSKGMLISHFPQVNLKPKHF